MGFFFRVALMVLGTLAFLVAAGALVIRYVPISTTTVAAATAMSPIIFVLAMLIGLGALIVQRGMVLAGAGAFAVILIALGGLTWGPLFVGEVPQSGRSISVLTTNIMLGQGDVDDVAALVRDNDVAVLAVQELTEDSAARIAASSIATDLPHSMVRPGRLARGTAIYSRYPLSQARELDGFTFASLAAVAAIPGHGQVQVFAVHPLPPTWAEDWAAELEKVDAALQAVPEGRRVIALGDYNATTDHPQFRDLLSGGYADAGELSGAGWLPTYPTDKWYPALVGIDHVVVRGFGVASVTTHTISGTDHRALLATLK